MRASPLLVLAPLIAIPTLSCSRDAPPPEPAANKTPRTASLQGDWTEDAPGVTHKITVADLPRPYATRSARVLTPAVPQPANAWPQVPQGFKVTRYAPKVFNPREVITAPNGDLFVAQSGANRILVLRGVDSNGRAKQTETYAMHMDLPFGLAFYPPGANPQWLYVGNTGSVVRFPYKNGDMKATGAPEMVVSNIPSGGRLTGGGHWTRDVRFSADGKKMYVSVGSASNDYERGPGPEKRRSDILEFDPDGKNEKTYAWGIRNAVGLAIQPGTGDLWASVNERDGLGDDLPPDYITRVKEGQFYGWPWYYIGDHRDPRHTGERGDLRGKIAVPEVLIQSHSASLCMSFYTGSSFPAEYKGEAFACQHGSWNREKRTGYKVIRVRLKDGVPTGEYEDFMTGFVTPSGSYWGRPVGVTTAADGALIVTDDGGNCIWRVQYKG